MRRLTFRTRTERTQTLDENSGELQGFVHAESVDEISENMLRLTFPGGLEFYTVSNVFEAELLYNEIWVIEEYLQAGISLDNITCIIDVGANVGLFTLFVKSRCPGATMYAIEPIEENFEILQRNVRLHELDHVHLYNFALGKTDGSKRDFIFYPNMTANSTATPASKDHFYQVLGEWRSEEQARFLLTAVPRVSNVRTLSALLAEEQITRVDLLKIDVEGDELEVIKGIEQKDQGLIKQIAAEIHSDELAAQCQECLREMGFCVTTEVGMTSTVGCSYLYATRL
jgi:FkbM family methyltransferase